MSAPDGPDEPSKRWSRSTTSRPDRATTDVETLAWRDTTVPTSTTTTRRPGTMKPVKAGGARGPSGVVKVMSTTASPGKGLNSTSSSVASRVVAPAARYQVGDDDDAHGDAPRSLPPPIACSTITSPRPASTTAAAYGASRSSTSRVATRLRGATSNSRVTGSAVTASPWAAPGMAVRRICTGWSPGLATVTLWSIGLWGAALPAAQYHVEPSASAGGTDGARAAGPAGVAAPSDAGVARRSTARPPATTAARAIPSAINAGARRPTSVWGCGSVIDRAPGRRGRGAGLATTLGWRRPRRPPAGR